MLRQVHWFVLLFCFVSPVINVKPAQTSGQTNALLPGSPIAKDISAGQTHSYTISLSANSYLHLVAEQRGADIFLALLDPSGKSLIETYSPIGSQGAENLYFIAESAGDYTLRVRSVHSAAATGGYALTLLAARSALPEDSRRVAAQRNYFDGEKLRPSDLEQSLLCLRQAVETFSSLGEEREAAVALIGQGRTHNFSGKPQLAQECFERALALFRKTEDKNGEALALYRVAEVYGYQDWRREMEFHQRALALTQATNNQILEAYVLSGLGDVHRSSGQLAEAQTYYERARQLQSITSDERSAASTLVQMGTFFYVQSKFQASLEAYRQAAQIFRRLQARREEANALIGVGNIWLLIGEYEKAAEQFEQSLRAAQSGGYRHVEAIAQANLAVTQMQMGQYEQALRALRNAQRLGEAIGDVGIRAEVLQRMGEVFAVEGNSALAEANFKQSLQLYRDQASPNGEADVMLSLGRLQYQFGQTAEALARFQTAREKWQSLGDRLGMARALSAASRAYLVLNQNDEALRCNQQALTMIESLRGDLLSYDLRATLSATFQSVYEQQIALLMRRHRQAPAAGYDRQALQVSEQARARSLLELLSEARAEIRTGVDAELLAQERETQRALNAKAEEQLRLSSGKNSGEQIVALNREITALTAQYQQISARIRANSPAYAALTQPQPLTVAEIQQQVLDDDTLLLEYALGDESGFLWVVGKNSIASYELPKRAIVEAVARRVYDLLTARQPQPGLAAAQHQKLIADAEKNYWPAAAALSRMLIEPCAAQLGEKRLLIVASGALQYVPFSALPIVRSSQRLPVPLTVNHEILNLPSASVLAVLRREFSGRAVAPKGIAVLADPVFSALDSRVKNATSQQRTPTGLAVAALSRVVNRAETDLPRLLGSRDQATEISALFPPEQSLTALDFKAGRELALSPELRQYRMIHFATHGLLDARHPELSGLALSQVNETGQPQDGFLRLHEIYNLKLNADLVVLSACQTALGKDVLGEGLVGLTRGFMYAGVPRIAASLWKVEDLATAQLMKRFYRGILRGDSPAAALRTAQIEMWKTKQWQSPYFWSAFTLQGEWKQIASQ